MYNRSVRAVKLTYEALSRILIERFEEELEPEGKEIAKKLQEEIVQFNEDLNEESLNEIIDGENFRKYNIKYIDFIDNIRQCGGDLASFWISFLDVSQILLNIIYATRSGDWKLLLESLKDVVLTHLPTTILTIQDTYHLCLEK